MVTTERRRYFYSYRNKVTMRDSVDFYDESRCDATYAALTICKLSFRIQNESKKSLAVFKKGFQAGKTFNPIIEFADDLKEK